jgi:POT family proton-dependent oligopeptide transporter
MTVAEATPSVRTDSPADTAFFGHPKGLGYLACTEAFERFSFYGMQILLGLYLVHYLLLPGHIEHVAFFDWFRRFFFPGLSGQPLQSEITGNYFAFVYFTPLLGGLLADSWLGKRRTVLIGAVTMAAGHFLMAFDQSFLFALLLLVLGSGMLKGNIAGQVGDLYDTEDPRRAMAFQIFYFGINAGVIISPWIVGTLGEKVGWHWGFGAAGIGMLISLVVYLTGQKHLAPEKAGKARDPFWRNVAAMDRKDWLATLALALLIPVIAIAIIPNNQIFNAYLIWADEQFAMTVHGFTMPTTWLVTYDAIVSLTFLLGVAFFYRWYGRRWKEPDELTKMIIGSAFSILGTLCLYMAAATQVPGHKISLIWPAAFHVINSIAFAHLLPISLALFVKLAPRAINSIVIGLYYLAFFTGNKILGHVGGWYSSMPTTQFWLYHAGFAAAAGVVFLLFKLFLSKRLMHAPAPLPDASIA